MAFRLFSDLHNEFSDFSLPALQTDADDVLVLAGDIGVVKHLKTFEPVVNWARRFRTVIHVMGNHEYYHGSLLRCRAKLREFYSDAEAHNVIVANDDVIRVDNVSFICGTLWTDCKRGDPMVSYLIQNGLNDYKYIRTGSQGEPYRSRMQTGDVLDMHRKTKAFIFSSIAEEKARGQKTVVVSHHGPTLLSVNTKLYGNDPLNWAYVSDLSEDILDTQPDIWVHGHTHHSFDYTVGETHVITNPRGYAYPNSPAENHEFNPELRIEV